MFEPYNYPLGHVRKKLGETVEVGNRKWGKLKKERGRIYGWGGSPAPIEKFRRIRGISICGQNLDGSRQRL